MGRCAPIVRALLAFTHSTERQSATSRSGGSEVIQLAGTRIVEACLPFVVSIALEYRRWGVPLEDIIQQGNLGLLKAAAKFDTKKECRLATYAAYWIRAEIREYVVRSFRVVRLGTTKGERRALRAYRRSQTTDPAALAAVSGLSEERVRLLLPLLAARETSLDANVGDMPPAIDRLPSSSLSPEDEAAGHEITTQAGIAVRAAVGELDEREQMIIRARLMTEDPPTLQELGNRLGVSKERRSSARRARPLEAARRIVGVRRARGLNPPNFRG